MDELDDWAAGAGDRNQLCEFAIVEPSKGLSNELKTFLQSFRVDRHVHVRHRTGIDSFLGQTIKILLANI